MSSVDMMEKIAKLLAMAEGASTPEEAAAFTEKAQKLATLYAVDYELAVFHQQNRDAREEPVTRRVVVGESGRQHKNRFWVDLALAITRNNDVRCTISGDNSAIWAYGYPSDIDVVEQLFTSLNVQMVDGANKALAAGKHKELGVHGRTFRPNFYDGYVKEMEYRLSKARTDAMAERRRMDEELMERLAAAATDAPKDDAKAEPVMTGALVMVKKAERVKEFYDTNSNARGTYRTYGATTRNYGAQNLGRTAAKNASIGGARALGGTKKSLT